MTWYRSGIAGTVSAWAPARRSSTASAYTVSRLGATTKCDVGFASPGRTFSRLTPKSCAKACIVRTVVTNGKPARNAAWATAFASAASGGALAVGTDVDAGDARPSSPESEQPAATPASATPTASTSASCRNCRRFGAVTSRWS